MDPFRFKSANIQLFSEIVLLEQNNSAQTEHFKVEKRKQFHFTIYIYELLCIVVVNE